MITVKFLIQKSSDTEMTILCQDGGLTFIEYNENCFVSIYHSMRLPQKSNSEIFDNLIETDRKISLYDWPENIENITRDMILDAVNWLYYPTEQYLPQLIHDSTVDMFKWLQTNYSE